MNWSGKNILIIGAARQGLALTRYLIGQNARITLNDHRTEAQLREEIAGLAGQPVRWVLGEHPLSLLENTDLVAVSGGVPLEIPVIVEAQRRGIPVTNDSQIFMESVPCPVIGITGSAGKTTTTSLVGEIAKAALGRQHKAWVGGNIGTPLIDKINQIQTEDQVILELSSFQLELMKTSPQIALITNITPNHLDRHGTMEAYTEAKAHILVNQNNHDTAILNRDDPGAWNLRSKVNGKLLSFGFSPLEEEQNGTMMVGNQIITQMNGKQRLVCLQEDILLIGSHNLLNVMAACTISLAAGYDPKMVREVIRSFRGVEHRLELVRSLHGVRWINDSIASAPERTMAAINAFNSNPIVLLLGGKDKNLPWDKLAELVTQKVDHVFVFGDAAPKIEAALTKNGHNLPFSLSIHKKMEEALIKAAEIVESGDVVLLSPGCTSYDEFIDFADRGERFRSWVNNLQ